MPVRRLCHCLPQQVWPTETPFGTPRWRLQTTASSIRLSAKSIFDNAHRHSSRARSRSKVWYSTQSHECPCSANYPRDHRTAHSRRFRVHLVDSVGSRHCRRVLFLVLCAAQKTAEVKFFLNRSSTPALRATDGNAGRRGETYPLQYGIGDRSRLHPAAGVHRPSRNYIGTNIVDNSIKTS